MIRETKTIDVSEYEKLLKDSLILELLIQHGVEHWSGYEKALG